MGERLTKHYIFVAWKLGLHPTKYTCLNSITITSNLIKWAPNKPLLSIIPPGRLNFAYHCYKATNYMYHGGEIDQTLYICCLETRLASNKVYLLSLIHI